MAAGDPPPRPPPALVALDGQLFGVLGLVEALRAALPALPEPVLEPGLPWEERRLPALRLRPPGAPEVLVAWSLAAVGERARRAFLDACIGPEPREIFLFEPEARPPAPALAGWLLEAGRATPSPDRGGALESRALGLLLRPEGARLRVVQGQGPIPFADELRARLDQARAEAARWRQRAERKEAEAARARAEAARQKLRAEHWKSDARRARAALGEGTEEATAELVPTEE